MYGYVSVNTAELKMREFDEYQAWYCGLCNCLKKDFGRAGQLTIQHDMTFLIYLLQGLYEPEEHSFDGRCIAHPAKKRTFIQSEISSYAADMNILLAWYKLVDDWEDDRSKKARVMMAALKKGAKKVQDKYPEKAKAVDTAFSRLSELEKGGSDMLDEVSGCFGDVMAEVCDYKNDEWSDELRRIGFYLGKFIYIMDAYEDMEADRKKGDYNCLIKIYDGFEKKEDAEEFVYRLLNMVMAECARAFEMLPIVKNAEVLRNIIYAGVWGKWTEMHREQCGCEENANPDTEDNDQKNAVS